MLWVVGFFFAKLLNHSMFEIPIVLGGNDGLVDFPGQKLESGIKLELFSGVAIFGKLDFEEVEPFFWFHLLEGANLNLGVVHCMIGITGKVCCCNSQWWLTENVGATGVNKNLTKSHAVVDCWGGCDVPGSVCAGTGCRLCTK